MSNRLKTRNRLRRISRTNILFLACVLATSPLFSGCGSGSSSPKEIVGKAIEVQGKLKSVRVEFDVSMQVSGGPSGSAATSYHGEGYYESPDRSKLTVTTPAGQTEVITVGDRVFVKPPDSSKWARQKVPQNMSAGASPSDIRDYLKYTKNLKLVEKTGDTYHLRFTLDVGRYARRSKPAGSQAPSTQGMEAEMDVWVLQDGFYVQRARMGFKGDLGVGAGNTTINVRVEFSDFNKPVTIETPR